jgi:hypothetical protein
MIHLQPNTSAGVCLRRFAALRRVAVVSCVLAAAAACMASPAIATDGWFDESTTSLSLRYRIEHVDQDAFDEDATASTLRTRLTFQSGRWHAASFLLEADDVRTIGWDNFNAGGGNTPGRTRFPVVADPTGTEINQAYIDLATPNEIKVRFGRQRIVLDNQRFIGAVGWRQNEQTYDAVSLRHTIGPVDFFYGYVDTVRTIFGERVPAGRHRQNGTHLVNVSGLLDVGRLSAYLYEIDNETVPANSTRTVGARLAGSREAGGSRIGYALEYAHQRDAGRNPVSFRTDYRHAEASWARNAWHLAAGIERLGGDADRAGRMFRTPLATLHAFNGRTDKFLTTPPGGLTDLYLRGHVVFGPTRVEARYHDFSAADGDTDIGREWSLAVGRGFGARVRGDLIVADFRGRGGYDDTRKAWFVLGVTL